MPDVVVIGQIARDLVLRVRGSPDSPTTNVLARREMLGGKGTNQAVIAALTASLNRGEPSGVAARRAVAAAASTAGRLGGRPNLTLDQ